MNNIKQIREIYGATQEQIATALGVNRVTVANWESDASIASSANREKMSMYFGIGPEFFYDKPLNDTVKEMIVESANKAKQVESASNGERNKEEEFNEFLSSISFPDAMKKYMFSMKLLLAIADNGELEDLKTALLINKKMGARLEAIVDLRAKEQADGEPSLIQLLEDLYSESK